MIDAKPTLHEVWSAMSKKNQSDRHLNDVLDQLEQIDKKLKASGEDRTESTFRLPYAGAEPIIGSTWK